MAEAFGIASSIIAVIQIAQQAIELLNDIRSASSERRRLTEELRSFCSLLYGLHDDIKQADIAEEGSWLVSTRALSLPKGPLEQSKEILQSLVSKLAPTSRLKNSMHTITWPFEKKDVDRLLNSLEHQKSFFTLALQRDQMNNSKAIMSDTTSVSAGVERLNERQDDVERRAITSWLSSADYLDQQIDFSSQRQEGTGQWLLDSVEFKAWLNKREKTLFCPGIPGAGKTMIACAVIEHLQANFRDDDRTGICYIYCNYKRQQEQRLEYFLASMVEQLVRRLPCLPVTLRDLYEKRSKITSRLSLTELVTLLQSVIASFAQVFVVIDALDECNDVEHVRKQLLKRILTLQTTNSVHLFATSRLIPEISSLFEGASSVEIRASQYDVQRYLDAEIEQLPLCVRRSEALQHRISTTIIDTIDGMFLLAKLHVDSLRHKKTAKAVISTLEALPKGSQALDSAYQSAIERIESQDTDTLELAKQVLSWITYAERHLTALELQHALATEVAEPRLDDQNITELEDMLSACAGLVTIEEQTGVVRFVHYTTQEYFERIRQTWSPEALAMITRTCISYISFDVFASGLCHDYEELEARLQQNAFFEFASRYWGLYAKRLDTEDWRHLALGFLRSDKRVQSSIQALLYPDGQGFYMARRMTYFSGLHLASYFELFFLVEELSWNDLRDSKRQYSSDFVRLLTTFKTLSDSMDPLYIEAYVEASKKAESFATDADFVVVTSFLGGRPTVQILPAAMYLELLKQSPSRPRKHGAIVMTDVRPFGLNTTFPIFWRESSFLKAFSAKASTEAWRCPPRQTAMQLVQRVKSDERVYG